jgi:hypothetical protein
LEVDGKDLPDEHPSNSQSEVDGMDIKSIHMVEDTSVEVEGLKKARCVMLVKVKHQTDDEAEGHLRTHLKRELGKLGLEGC